MNPQTLIQVFRKFRELTVNRNGKPCSGVAFMLMTYLHTRNGCAEQREVRKAIEVNDVNMTSLTQLLVERNYVERLADAKDRRLVILRLTELGASIIMKSLAAGKEIEK